MQKLFLLLFIFSGFTASAQKIVGTVSDMNGRPLSFATIILKGTSRGVTTNNHGEYSISLNPGTYTLECRYVGYGTREKQINLSSGVDTVNFILAIQQLTLKEVIIKEGGEDPAYEIIRQAIKKRPYYEDQVKSFKVNVYIKGLIKLRNLPEKILGKKIPEEDRRDMGVDSAGRGIIYLSESVAHVSVKQPDQLKIEVISNRVSGSNGFGFDFPTFINFYKNNVTVFAGQLNPRGFVSPIADGAMNFYKYKFLGSYFEDGKEVNVIKVMPKRKYEPLFSGIINITENDWRIFSCNLTLTRTSQLEVLDTLQISQIHVPVNADIWRVKNQTLHVSLNQLGISAEGNFVNVYSDYDLNPDFPKKYFGKVFMKYDTASNKKSHAYWDSTRPIPLEPEEIRDYRTKDSALVAMQDSLNRNIDSLRKNQGKLKLIQVLWTGVNRTHFSRRKNMTNIQFSPLLKTLQYTTVEGVVLNPSIVLSKYVKGLKSNVAFIADVRYGFNNQHLNPWAGFRFSSGRTQESVLKMKSHAFYIAGGKRVSQFYKQSDVTGLSNSIGTLLYGSNDMKIYENYFGKAGYGKFWENGTTFLIEGEYEDRIPVDNTTDFIFSKKWRKRLTPNYPVEILTSQFTRHQAVLLHASLSFKPGQRFIQYPRYRIAIGSKYPQIRLDYTKGIKNLFGSDVDYDKWALNVSDEANLKLAGSIKYNITIGGFLNSNSVFVQDYKHYKTSFSHVAGEYVKSLQMSTVYQFSNHSPFYTEFLFEHHASGLLTNKVPLLKKLNWTLVEGANLLYINPHTRVAEVFAGLENIFKIFRIDAVVGFQNGVKPVLTYRIGFGGLLGNALNIQRFSRTEKIIDAW